MKIYRHRATERPHVRANTNLYLTCFAAATTGTLSSTVVGTEEQVLLLTRLRSLLRRCPVVLLVGPLGSSYTSLQPIIPASFLIIKCDL